MIKKFAYKNSAHSHQTGLAHVLSYQTIDASADTDVDFIQNHAVLQAIRNKWD
jgi:hypothetical protein